MKTTTTREKIDLPFGHKQVTLRLPSRNFAGLIDALGGIELEDLKRALWRSLDDPIGTSSLTKLVAQKKPRRAVVIVSDHTRRIPNYSLVLDILMDCFADGGVSPRDLTMLVATGNHRPPSRRECLELYGERPCRLMNLVFHDSRRGCLALGRTGTGERFGVNRLLVESDFVLATGKITPHYLAGFSGGRKAVMPGCASRESIEANHSLVARRRNIPGRLSGNPIHRQMTRVAALVGIDFLVNLIPTPGGGLAGIVSGHWDLAWRRGVRLCRRVWSAKVGQPADCLIASAGGYPYDINLYQMQRILNNLEAAVKPGGTILLVGECREGVGQEGFGHWMKENTINNILATPEGMITGEGHRAYATAMVMRERRILLLSRLSARQASRMKFRPVSDLREGLRIFRRNHGSNYRCYVAPRANAVLIQPKFKQQ
jgi:nickel-dependent lactate racemase